MDIPCLFKTQRVQRRSILEARGPEDWPSTPLVSINYLDILIQSDSHLIAAAVTFIAFLMSFSQHITVTLFASLMSFLAAFLTLVAFACDIALLAFLKHQVNKLNDLDPSTKAGPGTDFA